MKVVATADVHYGVSNNEPIVKKFAQKIIRIKADVLILVGDTFAIDQKLLVDCLRLFDKFQGPKLFIAGNHDLWTTKGNSLEIYDKILPKLTKDCGFNYLDQSPYIYKGIGFVGNIGWYDYSFKDKSKPIPLEYYTDKQWPGVVSWNDKLYVHLGMSDHDFTQRVNRKLEQHLALVSKQVDTIICTVHHVPFKELLRISHTSLDKFLNAFSGSQTTGEIIRSFPKVEYVFCGHTHQRKKVKIGNIIAINIGSDYLRKKYEIINI